MTLIRAREKEIQRMNRHKRIRKKVFGTTTKPRVCLHRSLKNLSAQLVDDTQKKILFGVSTRAKVIREKINNGGNKEAAAILGTHFAEEAKKRGFTKICFDRGGLFVSWTH